MVYFWTTVVQLQLYKNNPSVKITYTRCETLDFLIEYITESHESDQSFQSINHFDDMKASFNQTMRFESNRLILLRRRSKTLDLVLNGPNDNLR